MISSLRVALLLLGAAAGAQASSSSPSSTSPSVNASTTDIPIYNATVRGTPNDTSVQVVPDASECDYISGDDLYCFPYPGAFVTMTGWTRFFYNRYYGLINNSGLVDITMYFATNDAPAASWIGVENTGNVPINVNISWFTSTLPASATYSAADPYYFYVRPNSAVYNAYPTGSSVGPTFYAVQTPAQKLQVPVSASGAALTVTATPSSSALATPDQGLARTRGGGGLSGGTIAGIVIGAVALFFVLVLLGAVLLLLTRRRRHAEETAAAAVAADREKARNQSMVPGNLFTQSELFAAGLLPPPRTSPQDERRPSMDQTDSSDSMPIVISQSPFARQPRIHDAAQTTTPETAQIRNYSRPPSRW